MTTRGLGSALSLLAFGWCATALAWKFEVPIGPTVHGHHFERVVLDSEGCVLKVRLSFEAPPERYKSRSPTQNTYRFHARLRFEGGQQLTTRVFYNDAPGRRVYEGSIDTSGEGCPVARELKLVAVDVESCRGKTCTPAPFQ